MLYGDAAVGAATEHRNRCCFLNAATAGDSRVPHHSGPSSQRGIAAADLKATSLFRSASVTPVKESAHSRGGQFAVHARSCRAEAMLPIPFSHHINGLTSDGLPAKNPHCLNSTRDLPEARHGQKFSTYAGGPAGHARASKVSGREFLTPPDVGIMAVEYASPKARCASSLTCRPAQIACVPTRRICFV